MHAGLSLLVIYGIAAAVVVAIVIIAVAMVIGARRYKRSNFTPRLILQLTKYNCSRVSLMCKSTVDLHDDDGYLT